MSRITGAFLALFVLVTACRPAPDSAATTGKAIPDSFFHGTWTDTSASGNGQEGLIFGPDNYFYMIVSGDVVGGNDSVQSLSYQLKKAADLVQLNIIFTRYTGKDSVQQVQSGTIEVLSKDNTRVILPDETKKPFVMELHRTPEEEERL